MIKKIEKILLESINSKFNLKLDWLKITESPKNMFWDFSFNWWILARDLKKNPNIILEELKDYILSSNNILIDDLEVTWAYLNIKLKSDIYTNLFNDYLKNWFYNGSLEKNNKSIVIDYIWANVWKPLHIGHMCTPNQWQVLVNIYRKLWYDVIADSHIGDWWIIFWKLITAFKLWWDLDELEKDAVNYLLKLYVKISDDIEKENEIWITDLEQRTRDEFKLLSEWNIESVELWKNFTKYSIESMQIQLNRLNVKPDFNIWESFYEWLWLPKLEDYPDLKDDMHSIVNELIEKKNCYEERRWFCLSNVWWWIENT